MRAIPLTTIKSGINRLRTKGGARADTLYDLLNGYVTEAGTVFLMGMVRRQEAADATEVARTTGGVRKVVRLFEYLD